MAPKTHGSKQSGVAVSPGRREVAGCLSDGRRRTVDRTLLGLHLLRLRFGRPAAILVHIPLFPDVFPFRRIRGERSVITLASPLPQRHVWSASVIDAARCRPGSACAGCDWWWLQLSRADGGNVVFMSPGTQVGERSRAPPGHNKPSGEGGGSLVLVCSEWSA